MKSYEGGEFLLFENKRYDSNGNVLGLRHYYDNDVQKTREQFKRVKEYRWDLFKISRRFDISLRINLPSYLLPLEVFILPILLSLVVYLISFDIYFAYRYFGFFNSMFSVVYMYNQIQLIRWICFNRELGRYPYKGFSVKKRTIIYINEHCCYIPYKFQFSIKWTICNLIILCFLYLINSVIWYII